MKNYVTVTLCICQVTPLCTLLYLIHASFGPPQSTTQTAARSVRHFAQLTAECRWAWPSIFLPSKNCPFTWGDPNLNLACGSLGLPDSTPHLDRYSLFYRLYYTHIIQWQTDRRYDGVYTVNHKKRDILLLTIPLANLNRFLQFFKYHFNREEILHATVVKFTTSP